MKKHSIIIEITIPFSVVKHAYLDDFIIPGWDSKRMESYAKAVITEIEVNAEEFSDCCVEAIRFGSGTASNAGAHIAAIMRAIRKGYDVSDDATITMQSAISNISGANMPFFKRAGIKRFDFEMMSLDSATYITLNKVDNLNDLPYACDHFLHSYANDSLGYILAYGNNQPSIKDANSGFKRSIISVTRSHASHLILRRAYVNNPELDTLAAEQLAEARDILARAEFEEYIPRHFAKDGKIDRYFLADYALRPDAYADVVGDKAVLEPCCYRLAFGLGACTVFEGVTTFNTQDLDLYLASSHDYARITEKRGRF